MLSVSSCVPVMQGFKIYIAGLSKAPIKELLAPAARGADKNACAFPKRL